MNQLNQVIINKIKQSGPNRVVIDIEGTAVNPKRAAEMGVQPDIVYVRKDGWSLGAPNQFKQIAFDMWSDEWIGSILWD